MPALQCASEADYRQDLAADHGGVVVVFYHVDIFCEHQGYGESWGSILRAVGSRRRPVFCGFTIQHGHSALSIGRPLLRCVRMGVSKGF